MNRPIVITATTKVSPEDSSDDVARELAEELTRILDRADYCETEVETRIDHYLLAKAPHFIPMPEARVTVQIRLDLDL